MSGNGTLPDEGFKAMDELRAEIIGAIRRRRAAICELHNRALMGDYHTDRAVHEGVERLLADIIREFEDMGFRFDPYTAIGVLKALGKDWLSHALEYIVV